MKDAQRAAQLAFGASSPVERTALIHAPRHEYLPPEGAVLFTLDGTNLPNVEEGDVVMALGPVLCFN